MASSPAISGTGSDCRSLVVILSVLFWGWVLGAMGMLLAVPLTMTVKIALESSDDTRWIAVLMSTLPRRRARLGAGLPAKPRAQTADAH